MQGAYTHARQGVKAHHDFPIARGLRILLLEQEIHLRKVVSLSLKETGMEVVEASSTDEASSLLRRQAYHLLIVSIGQKDEGIDALLHDFRQQDWHRVARLIVITGERISTAWRSRHKPDMTIYKPYDIRHLCRAARAMTQPDEDKTHS